jgi:hypothetical protein
MANAFVPRDVVHQWSEMIGANPHEQQAPLNRMLHDQRRLARFVDENKASMAPGTAQITTYLVGVVARMFDLAGGQMKSASWDQMRAVEKRIQGLVPQLLPVDAGFPARARAVPRAQPHMLDEAIMALFERPKREGEPDLHEVEKVKCYLTLWVCTEVLDENWRPAKSFKGEGTYTYVPIVPPA